MYRELALQWLKSNGYSLDESLYLIRKTDKNNVPFADGKLLKRSNSFEVYLLNTPTVAKQHRKYKFNEKKVSEL
jgi:hypothetical protein